MRGRGPLCAPDSLQKTIAGFFSICYNNLYRRQSISAEKSREIPVRAKRRREEGEQVYGTENTDSGDSAL